MNIKSVLVSMRLRTLPLSLSGVYMGLSLALLQCRPSCPVIVFLILTTCLLQILSNLSNELGDALRGTDSGDRQGVHYSIQDGEISIAQMNRMVWIAAVLCALSGALLVYFAFGTLIGLQPVTFLLLGLSAIVAAMRYTLGRKPYGYRGLGDFYVFVFFGLVSTIGAYYICCQDLCLHKALLPACAIGFFSMGVLNVNNIRDMKSDARTRVTTAIRMGECGARIYHTALIAGGWICMTAFTLLVCTGWRFWMYYLTLPLFVLHLVGVWKRSGRTLDPMLPLLVVSTFLFSVLAGTALFL